MTKKIRANTLLIKSVFIGVTTCLSIIIYSPLVHSEEAETTRLVADQIFYLSEQDVFAKCSYEEHKNTVTQIESMNCVPFELEVTVVEETDNDDPLFQAVYDAVQQREVYFKEAKAAKKVTGLKKTTEMIEWREAGDSSVVRGQKSKQ